ncbi:hypothetical protein OCA22_18360 [Bacillus cereus]|nr:hypothetical protein [Bacillus cereus]
MKNSYSLCWINTPKWGDGGTYKKSMPFDSIDEIIENMKNCYYRGEWVEDENGNKVDIDLSKYTLKEEA